MKSPPSWLRTIWTTAPAFAWLLVACASSPARDAGNPPCGASCASSDSGTAGGQAFDSGLPSPDAGVDAGGRPVSAGGQPACDEGMQWCSRDGGSELDPRGGYCDNIMEDPQNCGGCFIACDAGLICDRGMCEPPPPPPPCPDAGPSACVPDGGRCATWTLCPADGGALSCLDTLSDPANCGGCGVQCGPGDFCSYRCVSTAPPQTFCDGGRVIPFDGGRNNGTGWTCQ